MRKFVALVLLYCSIPVLLLAGTGMETSYPANALKFGIATSDVVTIPAQANYDNKTIWSAGALMRAAAFEADFPLAVAKGSGAGAGWFFDQFDANGDPEVFIFTTGVNLTYRATGTPLKLNTWQFVGWQFDFNAAANNKANIYVSGDLLSPMVAVALSRTDPTGSMTDDSALVLKLGNGGGDTTPFTGSIALVFVSPSTNLGLSEFRAWQQNPLVPPRGCQGLWVLGRNGRGRVMDLSGQSNEGTITGAIPVEGLPLFARASRSYRNATAAAAALLTRTLMGAGR